MRALLKYFAPLLFATLAIAAQAAAITGKQAENYFARYVASGRGNTEFHISTQGYFGLASIRGSGDGTFTCSVFGLGVKNDDELEQRAKMIHEFTHCLVSPYMNYVPPSQPSTLAELVTRDLFILTGESIADARALIEIGRHDGLPAMQTLSKTMTLRRAHANDVGHGTTRALEIALHEMETHPDRTMTDDDAFILALVVGQTGAEDTLRTLLEKNGHGDVFKSPLLIQAGEVISAGVLGAYDAFLHGQFRNNVLTIHTGEEKIAGENYHVFVGDDGSIRTEAAIGIESARGLQSLKDLIASSNAPEHRLAILVLTKFGQLEERQIIIARGHFERWVKGLAVDSPVRHERVLTIITETIATTPRSDGLDEFFNIAAKRLILELEQ